MLKQYEPKRRPFDATVAENPEVAEIARSLDRYLSDAVHYAPLPDGRCVLRLGDAKLASRPHSITSMDGSRRAEIVQRGKQWAVLVDGREVGVYDDVWAETLTFSPDGRRWAFVGARWKKSLLGRFFSPPQEFVVVDGQETPAGFKTSWLTFSCDGRRFAYVTSAGLMKRRAVIDGVEQPPLHEVRGVTFSGDGRHVAYWGVGDGVILMMDGMDVSPVFMILDIGFDNTGALRLTDLVPTIATVGEFAQDVLLGKNTRRFRIDTVEVTVSS